MNGVWSYLVRQGLGRVCEVVGVVLSNPVRQSRVGLVRPTVCGAVGAWKT